MSKFWKKVVGTTSQVAVTVGGYGASVFAYGARANGAGKQLAKDTDKTVEKIEKWKNS